ncbi:MAG TPA: hybrid sensor histidine kinase/response regulator [Porphyromonadaceae bacterium]|jgi:signal transduction histidine kinase/ligand-binding sensor domain-containing protein/DNA-binding response OmpR family regulator|nr:hybrid sensor histidine kinase/response regulator [Porphyromonadaceae bacterium]HBG80799.1 hybrid sensor histidine kinase/response regulator [Porphyromonadaceae bacterium]HBK94465.1 hybrid sensor histidine kinase/response regulator [Porphyromonadaceae bacterium]HBQ56764.1 hybrid sensor histidine kinase/response regulator [Porphyromonadaceae bacterium]
MKKIICIFFLIFPVTGYAIDFDIKALTNKDGLSNSSINVVFQDSNQLMWFGTWDGLNLYNGREFQVYKPSPGNIQSISNNIVRDIIEEKRDYLWIATDIGINRFNVREKVFERFFVDSLSRREITNEHSYLIARNSQGKIIVSIYQRGLYYFDFEKKHFEPLNLNKKLNIKKIIFDRDDNLWILTKEKNLLTATLQTQDGHLIVHDTNLFLSRDIENFFPLKSGDLFIQTSDYKIYTYGKYQDKLKPLPFHGEIGKINDIEFNEKSIYLGTNKGLYLYDFNTGIVPIIENTPVLNVGRGTQNIIWVGTDMKGIFKIVPSGEKFRACLSENIPNFGNSAVRTFFEDESGTLWVGTKGSGIYNFTRDPTIKALTLSNRFNMESGLLSNSVYKIAKGFKNEYWIGTDGSGINYYDKKTKNIRSLNMPDNLTLSSVYAILPDDDDILWVGTSGYGMYKLKIDLSTTPYRVADYKQFIFNEEKSSLSNNIVYSIIKEDSAHLWIGTRGGGINRFNIIDETFQIFKFSGESYGSNDVLCMHKDNKGSLWVGTSMGLIKLTWRNREQPAVINFNEKNGMPNNTIHGILEDKNNNLWVSTNHGLAKLIPDETKEDSYRIISYFANDGLQDNEFSDGSYYSSPYSSLFYFGGISGFNEFNPLEIIQNEYMPELWLDAFHVDNTETDLSDYLVQKEGLKVLTLSHQHKSFSFRFVPIDYIAPSKCEIAYMLEGFHDAWVNLGTSNAVVFTNLPRGKYVLKVKTSNANKVWSKTLYSLPIEMTPPWWKSNPAYFLYFVFFLGLLAIIRKMILYRIRLTNDIRMKELETQKTEEIHQGKLRFFTNIAHEFSNSLTLIYGPCDKLLKEKETDRYTKKYLQVIKSNSERMQNLIEQLVEFRKAETGHLKLKIETVDISELIKYVIDNFIEILEQKKIDYTTTFIPDENIIWRTDRNNLEKIIFNLLSNAVKYTSEEEHIEINVRTEDEILSISIKNTGIGIKPEYYDILFDRFEVLNRLEKQMTIGDYPRHGIGLALCKSIVNILKGDISIESDGETYTLFEIRIPNLELTSVQPEPAYNKPDLSRLKSITSSEINRSEEKNKLPEQDYISNDGSVLIVEDDQDIRSMIKDLLSPSYNIIEASNGMEALQAVNRQHPILVISDIIMPKMNGVEFVKIMKTQEMTSHIPIILLSSKSSIESQIEGFEVGADAYINKPFNFRHLEVIVKSLLHKKNILEKYSNSPYSALEQYEGSLIHKEDKDIILNISKVIYDNIDNEELTIDFIANETAISKIQLYRKIKEITKKTPTEFIRSIRLTHAEKLLKTTNRTVQEVMYASGFNNKAYFYREFFKKYNTTPKDFRASRSDPKN